MGQSAAGSFPAAPRPAPFLRRKGGRLARALVLLVAMVMLVGGGVDVAVLLAGQGTAAASSSGAPPVDAGEGEPRPDGVAWTHMGAERARLPVGQSSPAKPILAVARTANGGSGSAGPAGWSAPPGGPPRWLDELSPDVSRIRC